MKKILLSIPMAVVMTVSLLAGNGALAMAAPTPTQTITSTPSTHVPVSQIAVAGDIEDLVKQAATAAKVKATPDSLPLIIGSVIQVVLGILGIVLLVILVYAGFKYMVAEGDKAKVEKARGMIQTAVIGLIIVLSAYAISYFVVQKLQEITGVLK